MTFYEIQMAMQACIVDLVDEETGEILGQEIDEEKLEELQLKLVEKIDGMCAWIGNTRSTIDKLSAEIKRLQNRKKSFERLQDRLKSYLTYVCDGKGIKTDYYSVSVKKGEFLDYIDRSKIPDEYKKDRISREPDTEKIKADLVAGKQIDGVRLREYSVSIR